MLKDKILSDDALDSVSGGVIVSQDEKSLEDQAKDKAGIMDTLKTAGVAAMTGKTASGLFKP